MDARYFGFPPPPPSPSVFPRDKSSSQQSQNMYNKQKTKPANRPAPIMVPALPALPPLPTSSLGIVQICRSPGSDCFFFF